VAFSSASISPDNVKTSLRFSRFIVYVSTLFLAAEVVLFLYKIKLANKIIINPPILESQFWTEYETLSSTVLSKTPSDAKISENPITNAALFRKIFNLAFSFVVDVPDKYARKPGIMGKTHGLTNDTIPATNAITTETSTIFWNLFYPIFI